MNTPDTTDLPSPLDDFKPLEQGPTKWTILHLSTGVTSSFNSEAEMDDFIYGEAAVIITCT